MLGRERMREIGGRGRLLGGPAVANQPRATTDQPLLAPLATHYSPLATHQPPATSHQRPHGFTLLEVLLSLALAATLVLGIAVAIDLYLKLGDRGRAEVEDALLARAVLHQVAADLRSAVRYDPLRAADAASGGSLSSLTGGGGLFEEDDVFGDDDFFGEEALLDDLASLDLAVSVAPSSLPGLYGNRTQLAVDVSRLPRADQYDQMLALASDGLLVDRVSDVKTVAYYVLSPEDGLFYSAEAGGEGGLVRRELDRAVTLWASQQGTLDAMSLAAEPMAPEVVAIEFLYYDGMTAHESWDSALYGGLPTAVEIALTVRVTPRDGGWSNFWGLGGGGDYEEVAVHRLLVDLPAADAVAAAVTDLTGQWDEEDWSTGETPETEGAP